MLFFWVCAPYILSALSLKCRVKVYLSKVVSFFLFCHVEISQIMGYHATLLVFLERSNE
jgi:hypothetical protein